MCDLQMGEKGVDTSPSVSLKASPRWVDARWLVCRCKRQLPWGAEGRGWGKRNADPSVLGTMKFFPEVPGACSGQGKGVNEG